METSGFIKQRLCDIARILKEIGIDRDNKKRTGYKGRVGRRVKMSIWNISLLINY